MTAIARVPAAHGLSDVNCVTWGPNIEANKRKAAGLAGRLADDDEGGKVTEVPGSGSVHASDMLASCADDGTVKVWALPSSPIAPMVAIDPAKEASGAINATDSKVSQAEVAMNLS